MKTANCKTALNIFIHARDTSPASTGDRSSDKDCGCAAHPSAQSEIKGLARVAGKKSGLDAYAYACLTPYGIFRPARWEQDALHERRIGKLSLTEELDDLAHGEIEREEPHRFIDDDPAVEKFFQTLGLDFASRAEVDESGSYGRRQAQTLDESFGMHWPSLSLTLAEEEFA